MSEHADMFAQPQHPEVGVFDYEPVAPETAERLVDSIKAASARGVHIEPYEMAGQLKGYEWFYAMRQPSDGSIGRIDVDYYPPQDTPGRRGKPEEANIRLIDNADPREDTIITSYKAVKIPDGWHIEKDVSFQESPQKYAVGLYNNINTALDPAGTLADIEAELEANGQERALGTGFVSEKEANVVIGKLLGSTSISDAL